MAQAMPLNSRGEYAVMAMIELARAGIGRPLPLSEIADNANISLSYLEQLIAGMRRHDLVKSYRGPGGGYILGKSAHEILISEILIAVEDSTPAKRSKTSGKRSLKCPQTSALWGHISEVISITLQNITLADVLHEQLENHPHTSKLFEIMAESA